MLDLSPRPRHAKGFGGMWDGLGALGGVAVGVAYLWRGHISGLLFLAMATVFAREALLKYRAGNSP